MPKLTAICYRLLQGEESAVDAAASGETHDFGGELVLTFQDGQRLFVSWVGEPVQYAIGTSDSSHFLPDASLTDFDVFASSIWAELIGQDVSLRFVGPENQVLEVSSSTDRLMLCSYERGHWWADEVTVCKEAPPPYEFIQAEAASRLGLIQALGAIQPMPTISDSIIGEFPDQGYVEALMTVRDGPSLRVCVVTSDGRAAALQAAETSLSSLIADIPAVERMAAEAVASSAPAVVFDVWIYLDGTASYTCGFFEGEFEGELVSVERGADGHLESASA